MKLQNHTELNEFLGTFKRKLKVNMRLYLTAYICECL